jgi:hypothetical protein
MFLYFINSGALAQENTFNGDWYTNFGLMSITVQGSYTEGTFGTNGGSFTGIASENGKNLHGNWFVEPSIGPGFTAGKFIMKISDDGKSFTGKTWHGRNADEQKLIGRRSPETSDNFSGMWKTDWGILIMTVENNQVTGIYENNDGKIEGTMSQDGNTVEGNWSQAPSYKAPKDAGKFVFSISDDYIKFKCDQWSGEKEGDPEDNWTGKKLDNI